MVGSSSTVEPVAARLRDLVVGRRRPAGSPPTAAAISEDVGAGELRAARRLELGARSPRRCVRTPVRRAAATRSRTTSVTSAPRRAASSASARPIRPGRAVADVADRVDRLARAAGGDEHAQAVERARREAGRRRAPPRSPPRITPGSASRPIPHSPRDASAPLAGLARSARRGRAASRGSRAWPGAPTCGCSSPARPRAARVQASAALVSRLSASPPASFAIVFADAGRDAESVAAAHELEVRDRVVVGRRVAREGAARGVGLELVDQHRRAGDALEGGPADEPQARRASGRRARRGRPWWPAGPARRPCRRRSRRILRAGSAP